MNKLKYRLLIRNDPINLLDISRRLTTCNLNTEYKHVNAYLQLGLTFNERLSKVYQERSYLNEFDIIVLTMSAKLGQQSIKMSEILLRLNGFNEPFKFKDYLAGALIKQTYEYEK